MLFQFLIIGIFANIGGVLTQHDDGDHHGSDDPLQWLRDSIPGEPGLDYPIFSSVDNSNFDCNGRVFGGYYADIDFGCQAYHVCLKDPHTDNMYPTSFLCPNGTIFQQQIFNCDWWYNVDCSTSEQYYGLVENAFATQGNGGLNGGRGQCPNVNPLSDADCQGSVSNCWSPGQGDTDCPNFGLCCFDGCANTCVDKVETAFESAPQAQTTPRPTRRPAPRPTTRRPAPRPTTRRPAPRPTTRRPTPRTTTRRPTPRRTTRRTTTTTQRGYRYPEPEVTFAIRPESASRAPVTAPALLYGVPSRRFGREIDAANNIEDDEEEIAQV